MTNQNLARAINYFAVFSVGEVDLIDTAQNYVKRSAMYVPSVVQKKIYFLSQRFSGHL